MRSFYDRRSAPVAVYQFDASGAALQQQSELAQADDRRDELATPAAGQHILVTVSLAGRLVGLLGQDPRLNQLFEPNRGHLLGDVGLTREVVESSCTPKRFAQ